MNCTSPMWDTKKDFKKSHIRSENPYAICNSIASNILSHCTCLVICTSETIQDKAVNFNGNELYKTQLVSPSQQLLWEQ